MKRFTLITVLAMIALLAFAGIAMAAPTTYSPQSQVTITTVTDYTYGAGVLNTTPAGTAAPGYSFYFPARTGDVRVHGDGSWKIINANFTGETGIAYFKTDPTDPAVFTTFSRAVKGQLVHTAFQLNTNSCASCHMTHTAQARSLLFRNGVYATCTACHDGTLGFLNVFAAPTATNPYGGSITAGTFGGNIARNASIHIANGAVNMQAAPGGNRTNATVADDNGASTWNRPFTCSSCHGPHGSHSIRLLHYNANNISLRKYINSTDAATGAGNTGGLWRQGLAFALSGGKWKATGFPADTPWMYGYNGATTISNVRYNRFYTRIYYKGFYNPNSSDSAETLPANVGSRTFGGPMANVDGAGLLNRFFSVKYGKGYAEQDAAQLAEMIAFIENGGLGFTGIGAGNFNPANLRIDVAGVLKVTATYNGGKTVYDSDYINSKSYSGKNPTLGAGDQYAYNLFCAACHTDYLGGGASTQPSPGTGVYSKAHRHTINRSATTGSGMKVTTSANGLLCVSCHFGHGVDSSFMSLADHSRVDSPTVASGAANPFVGANDVNPSSALKRYINMAVCWSCHANSSAASLKNSTTYWYGTGAEDGYGENYGANSNGTW